MIALLYAIATTWLIISAATFLLYSHEPLASRVKISILAPAVLAAVLVVWVVSRLEGLG
jgi:hypothetical protein